MSVRVMCLVHYLLVEYLLSIRIFRLGCIIAPEHVIQVWSPRGEGARNNQLGS